MIKGIFKSGFGALLLLSAYKLGPYTYELYQQGKASESWVDVEAHVETFKIRSSSSIRSARAQNGGQSSNPHADIFYHYQFNGIDYSGDRTGFGPYSKGGLNRPKRGRATVYVNPENPSQSVYIKGVSRPNLGAMAFALALGLAGLFLLALGLKNIIRD